MSVSIICYIIVIILMCGHCAFSQMGNIFTSLIPEEINFAVDFGKSNKLKALHDGSLTRTYYEKDAIDEKWL